MTRILPPGVSKGAFDVALARFATVVGAQWVFTSDDDRASYADPFDVGDGSDHAISAAVAPQSVEEVQALLRVANEFRIPLWPIGRGKNLAYGTAAPRLEGSVILDLNRMNRILEINDELGYALVEPGVGFMDLSAALAARGGKFWASVPSHSWGSVAGNALEHGVGYTTYGEHLEAICGLEVVLADGSVVRTGMGAVAGTREWQTFRAGYGPVWDGLFTQSNFGVVTKLGVWLMPEPEGMAGVTISVPRDEDLGAMIDVLRPLRLEETLNATYTIMNGVRQITRSGPRAKLYQGTDSIPRAVVSDALKKQGSGWWAVTFNLFDHPEGLDWRLRRIRERFSPISGADFTITRWNRGEPTQPWMRKEPGLAALAVVDWIGGRGGHTDFGPVVAPTSARVTEVYRAMERLFELHRIDFWFGAFGLGRRALVMVADMIYDRDDVDMVARVKVLYAALARDAAARGIGVYRAHLTFMDEAAAMFGYNDHALGRLNQRLKDALDPNGILAPGKQGIWPSKRRTRS